MGNSIRNWPNNMNVTVNTGSGVGYNQTTSQSFPESYFYAEVGRFRELLGQPSFWERDEEQRENIIHGLSFVYLNTVPDDNSKVTQEHLDKWKGIYHSTMTEYAARGTKIMLMPLTTSVNPALRGRPDCPECGRPHGVAKSSKDGKWYCYVVSHPTPLLIETVEEKIVRKIKKTIDEQKLSDIVLT
jgi:hypothetical protein